MSRRHPVQPESFGTQLGIAPGNVPVYSSFYESLGDKEMLDRSQFKNYIDGVFMGHKWQCVEFARRWLYLNKGCIFDDIQMAYEIFKLKSVFHLKSNTGLTLNSFKNGSKRKPEPGALLIWDEGGEFEATGHVAIITQVLENSVRIIEQNVEHILWTNGRNWSRELKLSKDSEDQFQIHCSYNDTSILGWVIQTEDSRYAESFEGLDYKILNLSSHLIKPVPGEWLDTRYPAQEAFVKSMNGHRLATLDKDLGRYFTMKEAARHELKHISNQVHKMFIRATDYVLENEELLKLFNLPEQLIPRIRQSWKNRKTHNVISRFDFAMSEKGIKVYEYNADSAGCFFECGLVQGLWALHNGVYEGYDAGISFFDALIESWGNSNIDETIHILKDNDLEEVYMAEYVKCSIQTAKMKAKIISNFDELSWDAEGFIIDKDGERVLWIWKSWAWETAIDQLRKELEEDENYLLTHSSNKRNEVPRLVDVLLHPKVMVFEPLWSLITSNKALLPILWKLFPDHPNLLESHFELTDSLKVKGYVSKPIVGRCGKNITIVNEAKKILEKTEGNFADRDYIYQELWALPKIDNYYTQISTFTVDGVDSGACLRCSESMILDSKSNIFPLRVVEES